MYNVLIVLFNKNICNILNVSYEYILMKQAESSIEIEMDLLFYYYHKATGIIIRLPQCYNKP